MEVLMCFGPSLAERQAATQQQEVAETQRQEQVQERAQRKAQDIGQAVTARSAQKGRRGGAGRRSLLTSMSGGPGYFSRF
jgi:hypothetical protein